MDRHIVPKNLPGRYTGGMPCAMPGNHQHQHAGLEFLVMPTTQRTMTASTTGQPHLQAVVCSISCLHFFFHYVVGDEKLKSLIGP